MRRRRDGTRRGSLAYRYLPFSKILNVHDTKFERI